MVGAPCGLYPLSLVFGRKTGGGSPPSFGRDARNLERLSSRRILAFGCEPLFGMILRGSRWLHGRLGAASTQSQEVSESSDGIGVNVGEGAT